MVGLTTSEVSRRLKANGQNTIATERQLPGVRAFLLRFTDPLVLILLAAAALSAFIGDAISLVIIGSIVLISVTLDFINSYKSEQAAKKLRERVHVTAQVYRDGKLVNVPVSHVVTDDVVELRAGNTIPADGKVLSAKDLYVDEASLTGESFPQEKRVNANVFMGSNITSGEGTILITETGHDTQFAHVARRLVGTEEPTEFDKEIRDFSVLIIRVTFTLVLAIFAFNTLLRHDILESLLFSLALAVGLTPALLPLIITLNLTKGSLAMARAGVIVRRLNAVQNFGSMDVLCTDKTGTLTEDRITLVKYVDGMGHTSEDVLKYAYLASMYSTSYESPLDRAVKDFRHLSTTGYAKVDEVPFTFERKRESVVVHHDGTNLLITKGAPESVFSICSRTVAGHDFAVAQEKISAEYEQLSSDGFRVLAIATKTVGKRASFEAPDEADMTFWGFVAFLDPAKKDVAATLRTLEAYGVEIKILSGDNALINERIAAEIQLPTKGVMTGQELDKLSDAQLAAKVESTTIFARVSPEQKLRIITMLRNNRHVIGYMGDGINDAPALRAADVGISVNNAVDVAKGTADLILLHKSLHELVQGILTGRRIFANTLKYLMMSLSSNFGNMISMAAASLFLPFLPMLATQILLNNLLYDTSQFTIPTDKVDDEYIRKPRTLSIAGIRKYMIVFGLISSAFDFATFGTLLFVLHLGEHEFQTGWFIESIATQIFVVFIIRTHKIPFVQSWPSRALLVGAFAVIATALLIILSPLAGFFHFQKLPAEAYLLIGLIVGLYLLCTQVAKMIFMKHVRL